MMLHALVMAASLAAATAPTPAPPDSVPAPAAADSAWSLERCEEAAFAVSPDLASRRARALAARAGADAAGAGLLPTLGLTGQASYTTETMSLEVPTPTGTRRMEFGDGSTTDLMLGVRAPLYAGGALRARRDAAEARWRASRAEVAADSLGLRLQVRRTFYAALGAEAAADAARQGEARLRRHLQDVEANIAAGTAAEEARLQVLARLRRTEQATVDAEARAASLRYGLGRLVGRPGRQIRPRADLDRPLLAGTESARPWDARPELRVLDARLAAAEREAGAASGSLRPSLEAQAGWHYGRPGVDALANEWMDYGTVALNLRWTLFDFGGTRDRVRGLRAESRALAATRGDVSDALRTRQADARTQVGAARTAAAQAADRLDLEKRRLELVRGRWREGHATGTELLDAQDDVTLAATDLAAARARLRQAEAELLAALGH